MGQVENVSVETDPAFDRALKAAVQRGGSDPDAVLNALVEELEITAPLRFSISGLGSGSTGQQGLDVVFQSGTNPNAAANNAATAWLPILRGLEGNGGAYSARASLVEVNGGYILAIGVKVEQPGDGGDEPDPVTLKSIAVNTPPAKTEYWVNETFDPTGMEITATYSNNTTTTINGITETDKKDVSWTPETLDTAGKQTVTISYGGKTAEVTVTVKISKVKEIKVTGYQDAYTEGESFVPNGMKVTVTYDDNSTKTISNITQSGDYGITWTPSEALSTTDTTITITYTENGKGFASANVPVTVQAKPVTLESITVSGTYKTKYISGESFDPAGMTITATYSDGTTEPVTSGYTWSPKTLSKDTTEVTISYGGKSTTVPVKILDENNSYDADTKTYSIATADGLMAWNDAVQSDLSLNCTLTEDINMTGKEWTPIGNSFQTYNGTFDGQGYSITSLNASSLFGGIGERATVKNLQLVDVELYESSGGTAGIVTNNYGQVIACSVTGNINAFSTVGGIANANQGSITACWFAGTLRKNESGGIVNYNFSIGSITACYWCANTDRGVYNNEGGTVEATKVDDSTVTWQTAVDGMNEALTGNDYQWTSGTDGLPVLQKKQ